MSRGPWAMPDASTHTQLRLILSWGAGQMLIAAHYTCGIVTLSVSLPLPAESSPSLSLCLSLSVKVTLHVMMHAVMRRVLSGRP